MIIIVKRGATREQITEMVGKITSMGLTAHSVEGQQQYTISVLGKTEKVDMNEFSSIAYVESVFRVSKPFKLASRAANPEGTRIKLKNLEIGADRMIVMAGPCSVESEDQVMRIARAVKAAGATVLRGGAFKPRSSPYAFQGMGLRGLQLLKQASQETGLPVISEAMDLEGAEMMMDYVDIFQIGARNMQNFSLLKELGKMDKPIMLKRGMSATIEEWLMSAEYILAGGNRNVLLCERGIRSFDSQYSRNTLDLNAIPILKSLTHLPIVVDPSHGTGHRHLVAPMALAGMAAGGDALIIEVHDRPEEALSDGPQALLPSDFSELMGKLVKMGRALDKNVITELERERTAA
ncbi:MAG: 3-deoxy-7-phosphoheptulonate synthase [Bdellovibrionales bacterium]|nr:3-deoxy-7-phosphoheptulonate synthase [Bdellovibrionales bacterium]